MSSPAVSIILPTYNRARFLAQAFASIRSQTFPDWELVVIDDGSTDDTHAIVAKQSRLMAQPVRYIHQENQGAYGARNTGLDHAVGRHIAFFDSDDVWLPHHLRTSVEALESYPAVDWIYGACRIVDLGSQAVIADSSFYQHGRPRRFMKLKTATLGQLRVIQDPRVVRWMIGGAGLNCGLQNSVIRRTVFERTRFEAASRNEAEDRLFALVALSRGHVFAYFDDVHVLYYVHEQNSSGSARGSSVDRDRDLHLAIIRGYEDLPNRIRLSRSEQKSLRRRISREYFWTLGYSTLWKRGRRDEALEMFRRGMALHPTSASYWKTYSLARLRTLGAPGGSSRGDRQQGVSTSAVSARAKE